MAYKDEWRTCQGSLRVQNTDYIASDYISTLQRAISGDYNKWGNGEVAFTSISFIDKYLRVPTKLSGSSLSYILYCSGVNVGQTEILNRANGSTRPFFRSTGQVSPTSKALDYMPRAYIVLRSVQEVMDTYQSAANPLVWAWISKGFSIGTSAPRGWFYDKLDFDTFYELMADYYVIDSITFYSNKNDGTQQDIIGRISRSNDTANFTVDYDNIIPLNVSYGGYNGEGYFGYYSHLVPNYLYSPNVIGTYKVRGGMTYGGLITNAFISGTGDYVNSLASGYFYTGGSLTFSQTPTNPLLDLHCATKDNWAKIFNAGGCAWSYDLDKVIAPDDSGLHKPTTPGQPDNPVDDSDGDGDNISDDVTYPSVTYLPTAARYMYALTDTKVKDVSNYLFSQTFLDDVRRLWTNPGDYIVDLSFYPIDFAESRLTFAPAVDGYPVYIGNLNSGITGKYITGGTTAIYGGYVDVTPYYNSYLDYAPNTSISVYIPYIGVRPLDIDLITGHKIHLMYYLDLGTGQFIAALGLDGDISQDELGRFSGTIGRPIAQYCGNIGIHIPLNGTSHNAYMINSILQATQIVSSAGALAGGLATSNISNFAAGVGGLASAFSAPVLKEEIHGTLTPSTGLYSPQQPYLIINRPITAEPAGFKSKQGYASCYSGAVSEFSGFLQCAAVDVPSADTMTVAEQTEIEQLLLGGIYCG